MLITREWQKSPAFASRVLSSNGTLLPIIAAGYRSSTRFPSGILCVRAFAHALCPFPQKYIPRRRGHPSTGRLRHACHFTIRGECDVADYNVLIRAKLAFDNSVTVDHGG